MCCKASDLVALKSKADAVCMSVPVYVPVYVYLCVSVCESVCMCGKASELVAVKSKADELHSQKAALDDHIATLKVTYTAAAGVNISQSF